MDRPVFSRVLSTAASYLRETGWAAAHGLADPILHIQCCPRMTLRVCTLVLFIQSSSLTSSSNIVLT